MEDCSMRDITLINATDFEILAPAITLSTDSRYAYCPSHSRALFSSRLSRRGEKSPTKRVIESAKGKMKRAMMIYLIRGISD